MTNPLDQHFADVERRLRGDPQRMAGLDVAFEFDLVGEGGGIWHLTIRHGDVVTGRGGVDRADMRCRLTVDDYLEMVAGHVSGRDLFFTGRMGVEGNAMLGMLLGSLMR